MPPCRSSARAASAGRSTASPTSCTPASPPPSAGWPPLPCRREDSSREATDRASRGRDEASVHEGIVIDLDDPRRAFLEPTFAGLHDVTLDQLLNQLPNDVAMRAQHRVVEVWIAQELHRSLQAVTLRKRRCLFGRDAMCPGERLHGLHAAQERAREDRGHWEWLED